MSNLGDPKNVQFVEFQKISSFENSKLFQFENFRNSQFGKIRQFTIYNLANSSRMKISKISIPKNCKTSKIIQFKKIASFRNFTIRRTIKIA